jgi:hypothetical protein
MAKGMTDSSPPSKPMPAAMDRSCQEAPKDQYEGGNLSGHDPMVDLFMVPDFQGMSGQGNNQSTDRPKGST